MHLVCVVVDSGLLAIKLVAVFRCDALMPCRTVAGDDALLLPPASPLLLLDLPFSPSALPQAGELLRCCPHGLLAHLPLVLQQMLQARGLTPLRVLIRGPPASGDQLNVFLCCVCSCRCALRCKQCTSPVSLSVAPVGSPVSEWNKSCKLHAAALASAADWFTAL